LRKGRTKSFIALDAAQRGESTAIIFSLALIHPIINF